MKYLDPKAGLTFKKIFGNQPDRLKNLLNTLQSLNENELIQQQQYLPTTEELEISGFTDAELRAYDKFWEDVDYEYHHIIKGLYTLLSRCIDPWNNRKVWVDNYFFR